MKSTDRRVEYVTFKFDTNSSDRYKLEIIDYDKKLKIDEIFLLMLHRNGFPSLKFEAAEILFSSDPIARDWKLCGYTRGVPLIFKCRKPAGYRMFKFVSYSDKVVPIIRFLYEPPFLSKCSKYKGMDYMSMYKIFKKTRVLRTISLLLGIPYKLPELLAQGVNYNINFNSTFFEFRFGNDRKLSTYLSALKLRFFLLFPSCAIKLRSYPGIDQKIMEKFWKWAKIPDKLVLEGLV